MEASEQIDEEPLLLESAPTSKPNRLLGIRHLQVALTFLGMFLTLALYVNLSVVIVAMVDNKDANPDFPEYDWNVQIQSMILSGAAWGITIPQIPAGLLAEKFGPKSVISLAMFFSSVFSTLTPVAASVGGWGFVFACRFVQGLFQGMIFPAIQVHQARWIPVGERGVLITLTYAGGQLGTVLTMAVCGVMSTGAGGWPSVFYLFGGVGVAWTVLWMLLGSNSPAEDRFISIEERAYIEDSLRTNDRGTKPPATPWKAILTSGPVWAYIVANCGWNWSFNTLLSEAPTFMKTVLGFNLEANGLLSALPYLLTFVVSIVLSITSDIINNRQMISLSYSRKLFNTIGFWIPAVALVVLAYSHDATLSVALINVAVSVNAAAFVGVNLNNMDLAPNYAGTIFGFSNCIASLVGCFGPLFVGVIVTESGSMAQWQIVFFVAAGIYFVTGLVFAVFGKAELQTWNDPPISEESDPDVAIN